LELEVELIVAVKTEESRHGCVPRTTGQKRIVFRPAERADANSDSRLLIPDFVTGDRAEPKPIRPLVVLADRAAIHPSQRIPPANELLHFDVHAKEVFEQLSQRDRASRLWSE
jgi:hypothetical protein